MKSFLDLKLDFSKQEKLQKKIGIPIINIVDETGKEIQKSKISKVALLGTKFTMEKDFFIGRLKQNFSIETILPNEKEKDFIHNSIYNEFSKSIFKKQTKSQIVKIINNPKEEGAEGIILGCTELSILIKQSDVTIPLFDTTLIHATSAVKFALGNEQ